MDKNAIKKYAVWARNELIARVSQKAQQYGITADGYGDKNADSINGVLLSATEKKQRQALIAKIDAEGFEQVMEEVAYTWFNRFTALRFMEVNNYLPSHTRVFTNEANEFKPQILADAISLELEGLDMDKVFELKNANKDEELYKYLLIVQCNALNCILPGMFQKIADYTELLLPDYLLRTGSVLDRMIAEIPVINFDMDSEDGQLEIIGWLYQYYNDEKKDTVINIYKGTVKKEDIPAATQLFTTDWVVRYIIDNSLGKYWIERRENSILSDELEYYVKSKSGHDKHVEEGVEPTKLSFFDPCMGSGHFLIYAFEVFMKIYSEAGYSEREAVSEIVSNNIFGLDIDERAAQLSYFSIMMKARQYDRRFLTRGIQPNVFCIRESNGFDKGLIDYVCGTDSQLRSEVELLIDRMHNAKEYGSIIDLSDIKFDLIDKRIDELQNNIDMFSYILQGEFIPFLQAAKLLGRKYVIVDTNPPYLNRMNDSLKDYINSFYKDYSGDLYSVFIYRNFFFCENSGYVGFMTPFVWMFNKTYEKLREYILKYKSISTLVQMEYSAFEEATVPICSFVIKNCKNNQKGKYFKLSDFKGGMEVQKRKVLEAIKADTCDYFYESDQKDFSRIPTTPIAYWVSEEVLKAFESTLLGDFGFPKQGFATGSNDLFMRLWHEVDFSKIGFGCRSSEAAQSSRKKWFPCNKGGGYRRWYGNNYYLANWENDGKEMRNFKGSVIRNPQFYFQEGMTWCSLTSGKLSMRYSPEGFVFESKGSVCFMKDKKNLMYILALMNTEVVSDMLLILSPTLDYHEGPLSRVPIIIDEEIRSTIERLAERNVELCKADWDSYEISWDFKKHPLMRGIGRLSQFFEEWKREKEEAFIELKNNETELNKLFSGIYSVDIETAVDDADISIRKADVSKDIKSLISYAVGCMFGRFSPETEGLQIADSNVSSSTVMGNEIFDRDNIIPITDDEYFEDDIVNRFVGFVKISFGQENLEENLQYIANALGGNLSARDTLRNYFLNEFFLDHCTNYSITGFGKRPIYWLFDSGKKNGFKCLVYMHRYQSDTIARIRTDYVHELQSRYRTALADLEQRINNASTSERVKLNKQLKTIQDQAEELRKYEERIHHLADQMISIDLDDGVKENYAKFQDVLAKIK